MWIVPLDLAELKLSLTPGQYLLPWYLSESEVDQLCWLLRGALGDLRGELRLDAWGLRAAVERKVKAPDALVVARVGEASLTVKEALEHLRSLGARYGLLQVTEPQEQGYGWLERHVKVPLTHALRAWAARPGHPLVSFGIRNLPVLDAAALTSDPIELIELLEQTIAHRMRYAGTGIEEEDYRRSLYLTAGHRLARRLEQLEKNQRSAALELILHEGAALKDDARFRAGAQALERVGLARFVSGSLNLGPLARSIRDPRLLGALESRIDEDAWSETARARVQAIREETNALLATGILNLSMGGSSGSSVDVPLPVELLDAPVRQVFPNEAAALEALETLRTADEVPSWKAVIPESIQERLVSTLRWLDDVQQSSGQTEQRRMARALEGLLRLVSARGPDMLSQQEQALQIFEEAIEEQEGSWVAPVRMAALFRNAWTRVHRQQSSDDLSQAERMTRECIALWEQQRSGNEAASGMAYLLLGEIAKFHQDIKLVRECDEKALSIASACGDPRQVANAKLSLARVALGENSFDEAEHLARSLLSFYEEVGEQRNVGRCLYILAEIADSRNDPIAAEHLWERAIQIARSENDIEGELDGLRALSIDHLKRGDIERGQKYLDALISLSQTTNIPLWQAHAYALRGISAARQASLDEVTLFLPMAIELYEKLGVDSISQGLRKLASILLGPASPPADASP